MLFRSAGNDLAGIFASAFKHDLGIDQELPSPAFAQRARQLCDAAGAALILDEVRAGYRLHAGGSWEPLGVRPDLSAWSKAIANGYALAAVAGSDGLRDAAARIFTTEALARGVYLNPRHNMFLSLAHTQADIDQALVVTNEAFAAVAARFGAR